MPEYDDHDEGQREEDEFDERQMQRDADADDFHTFDARRYLRDRYTSRSQLYLGEDPEAQELDVERRGPRRNNEASPGYGRRAQRYLNDRERLTEGRRQKGGALRGMLGLLTLFVGEFDPGVRLAVISFGCFGLLACAGLCGAAFLLLPR